MTFLRSRFACIVCLAVSAACANGESEGDADNNIAGKGSTNNSGGRSHSKGGAPNTPGAGTGGREADPETGTGGSAGDPAAAGASAAGASSAGTDAPSKIVKYAASDDALLNPERGFYTVNNLATARDLGYVRKEGKSLVYAAVHLDKYLGSNHAQDLPAQVLNDVQAGFDAVRNARIKAIVRFQYDDGEGYPGGANDAPESWILRHIEQLAPVLKANEDVLFLLQAGFIGAWGEWHTSKNFVDGPSGKEPRKRIVDALMRAVPESRRIALRYPAYKRMFYGQNATALLDLTNSADIGRAAHLNDCFVSGDEDVGTYQYEPMATLKTYLAEDTKYVPIGGETCATHARNACTTTLSEMERFHYTYINDDYHPEVLKVWETQGCRNEIEQRLGYRLALSEASFPASARPGGSFSLKVTLNNSGFAALTNTRPLFVVLAGDGVRHVVKLAIDVRSLLPGANEMSARLRLPASLGEGRYRLQLWLPDAAESLQKYPEYSLRFANADVWDAIAGENRLGEIEITDSAPGDADPNATSFAVIP